MSLQNNEIMELDKRINGVKKAITNFEKLSVVEEYIWLKKHMKQLLKDEKVQKFADVLNEVKKLKQENPEIEYSELIKKIDALEKTKNVTKYIELCNMKESLLSDSDVIKYIRFKKEIKDLMSAKEEQVENENVVQTKKKKECSHPLVYLISSDTDSHESRTYWTCRCVACGEVVEDRAKAFEGKTICSKGLFASAKRSPYSYDEIAELYQGYMNYYAYYILNKHEDKMSETLVPKILIKKFN